ncbi:MAG: N-acetylmuramoyl-L-alanine amidase [Acidobacteriia bacterium]|nr:N-acetylmuramoyl-L-alanine amidase [Terriglobia bacterium]
MTSISGRCLAATFAALLAAGAAGAAGNPTAKVTADTGGSATRVIVTLSQPVASSITTSATKVEIVFASPVDLTPAESKIDDAILKGWQARGDRTLTLSMGSAYKGYESFELKNPSRVVIDLRGDRPSRSEPSIAAPRAGRVRPVIVVDPGHGGVEIGAAGPSGAQEKDVALDLARRLKIALEREAGATVVLTRDEDRLVPLDERSAIANHNRALLFLSIHLNASKRRGAAGAETYFLAPESTDDEARTLAALENHASGVAEAPEAQKPEGDRGLDLILWDLAQNQYLAESARLAESVQKEMNALAGTKDRGVRQAPFRVLMGATMPAILVEAGFITDPAEESRLKDPAYLDKVVDAIVRAVRGYLEGRTRLDEPGAGR